MKKLIVGCGYLGLRAAKEWVKQGHEVYALTRTEERGKLLVENGIRPLYGNVADAKSLNEIPEVDTVLYSLGYDRLSSYSRREVTIDGLNHFLSLLPKSVKNFIFTSSISVYGQSEGEQVDEKSVTTPEKENGQSCLEAEEIVQSFFTQKNTSGLEANYTILRLAGIYGPGRVFRKIEALKNGEPIGGEPEAWLNLIHVDDACRVILKTEETENHPSLLLVSDDQPVTRREYYQELARIADAPQPLFDSTLKTQQRGTGLNKRCLNQLLKQTLNLELLYPDYRAGLKSIFEADSL